jgi:dynamin GTPase
LKYTLKLEDMRVKDVETSRFSIGKKFVFALFYTTGR